MYYPILVNCVVIVHVGFVLFVAFGGLLVSRWRSLLWFHLPAVAWGVFLECVGGVCPLTPLENQLRARSGEAGYTEDFIAHYLLATLYPEGLTRSRQISLGMIVLLINGVVYSRIWRRER